MRLGSARADALVAFQGGSFAIRGLPYPDQPGQAASRQEGKAERAASGPSSRCSLNMASLKGQSCSR